MQQKSNCDYLNVIIWLITMKMKMILKNTSHSLDISRPRVRHIQNILKYIQYPNIKSILLRWCNIYGSIH